MAWTYIDYTDRSTLPDNARVVLVYRLHNNSITSAYMPEGWINWCNDDKFGTAMHNDLVTHWCELPEPPEEEEE